MRRVALILACWLIAGIAWAGIGPVIETGDDGRLPNEWNWRYEGLGTIAYLLVFVVAYLLPESWRPITVPIALLWPMLLWGGSLLFTW